MESEHQWSEEDLLTLMRYDPFLTEGLDIYDAYKELRRTFQSAVAMVINERKAKPQ